MANRMANHADAIVSLAFGNAQGTDIIHLTGTTFSYQRDIAKLVVSGASGTIRGYMHEDCSVDLSGAIEITEAGVPTQDYHGLIAQAIKDADMDVACTVTLPIGVFSFVPIFESIGIDGKEGPDFLDAKYKIVPNGEITFVAAGA